MSAAVDVASISEKLLGSHTDRFVCSSETDLVVEGYPRSGNTFCVDYLSLLTGRTGTAMKIAHHTHDARNVLLGHVLKVPTVALLRTPADAMASYMIYSGADARMALDRYVKFYAAIEPISRDVLIAPFETYVRDFNALVTAINERFGLGVPLSEDPLRDAEMAKEMERERGIKMYGNEHFAARVAVPNEERRRRASELKEQVDEMLVAHPQATDLYNSLRNPAE